MVRSGDFVICAAAGACAALASVFGKLGGGAILPPVLQLLEHKIPFSPERLYLLEVGLRVICYAILVACNVAMWSLYVRSLQSLSSLTATVLNMASNLFCSGVFGLIIFQEKPRPQWLLGIAFISLGLLFLTKASKVVGERQESKLKLT